MLILLELETVMVVVLPPHEDWMLETGEDWLPETDEDWILETGEYWWPETDEDWILEIDEDSIALASAFEILALALANLVLQMFI